MSKRTFISLCVSIACALLLVACTGTDTATNTSTATNSNRTTTTTTSNGSSSGTTTTNTTTTTASGDKIGIAECDDFLAKYDACVSAKVPEAARAQYKSTLDQWRKSWRDMAANPQTKAGLTQACKMAADQAKTSMKPYGCDF